MNLHTLLVISNPEKEKFNLLLQIYYDSCYHSQTGEYRHQKGRQITCKNLHSTTQTIHSASFNCEVYKHIYGQQIYVYIRKQSILNEEN